MKGNYNFKGYNGKEKVSNMRTLLEMWKDDNNTIENKKLNQIIPFLGNIEKQENYCQMREYFQNISSKKIGNYIEECLTDRFDKSGFVLQDLVNEIGRRLEFKVEHGRYKGRPGENGFDGRWIAEDGHNIIIETKTTDAYRINLEKINEYRMKLIDANETTEEKSSILIVVGRSDTGDLEAQIRGSRYAWNIRIISADSLLRLLELKESFNNTKTISQIYGVLKPQEYTKVDELINLIFFTIQDADLDNAEVGTAENENVDVEDGVHFTAATIHEECIKRIENAKEIKLNKVSRSLYGTTDKSIGIIMVTSKTYLQGSKKRYWFAYHSYFKENLEEYRDKYIAYGCGSADTIFIIPVRFMEEKKDGMNITRCENGKMYRHVFIYEEQEGQYNLQLSKPEISYVGIEGFRI